MRKRERRLWRARCVVWSLLCLFALAVAVQPVQNLATRAVILGGVAWFWAGGLFLFWRWPPLRILFLAPALATLALAALPGVPTDTASLRRAYIQALGRYEGTPYLADGESAWGMDGAGLVRRGLIDAALAEAWRQRDLSLLRTAAALWWNDASPRDLAEEYQRRTYLLGDAPSVNGFATRRALPGDLAVTRDGRYALAFLGDGVWILADPVASKVVTERVPGKAASFLTPVRIVRWKRFRQE